MRTRKYNTSVRKKGGVSRAQKKFILSGLIPCLTFFAVFKFYPLVEAINLSFRTYNMLSPVRPFVGIKNYLDISRSSLFQLSVLNTFYYGVCTTLLIVALAIIISSLINSLPRFQELFRSFYFVPIITSMVAIAIVWTWLYQPRWGLFNQIFSLLGLKQIGWLKSPTWAMPSVIIVGVWQGLGLPIIIFLAGLSGIPKQYHEACQLDGGNRWHLFRYITLPLLKPVIVFVLVTTFMSSFKIFQSIYVMTQGGPLDRTRVLAYHIYATAFQDLKMGLGSSMAVVLFGVVLGITFFQLKIFRISWEL